MRVNKGHKKSIVPLFFHDFLGSGAWICQLGAWNCQLGARNCQLGVWICLLGVWICLWVSGFVFWVPRFVFWVSGFVFWVSGFVFGVQARTQQRRIGKVAHGPVPNGRRLLTLSTCLTLLDAFLHV